MKEGISEMETRISNRTENEARWRKRVAGVREHRGTLTSYCHAQGISLEALKYWRNKLEAKSVVQAARSSVRPQPFVPIQVVSPEPMRTGLSLPDARWVAELILHLSAGTGRDRAGGVR